MSKAGLLFKGGRWRNQSARMRVRFIDLLLPGTLFVLMVFLTPSNYLLPCHLSLDATGLWTFSSLLHEFRKASLWGGVSGGSQALSAALPQRAIKHRLLVNHNHCVICKCVYHPLWLAAAAEKSLGSPLLTAAGGYWPSRTLCGQLKPARAEADWRQNWTSAWGATLTMIWLPPEN